MGRGQNNHNAHEDQEAGSVLSRKVHAGQIEHQARQMSLPKVLRITLAKVADELFDMAMAVIGVRTETCKGAKLAPLFDDGHLLLLLDAPHRRRAAATFDPALVGAIIQQQTIGTVTPVIEGESRRMTATDAAICAPFLDALLHRAAPPLEDPAERALIEGCVFGARVEDPRVLLLAMEEDRYQILYLTVDIAGGARQGVIMLCLPIVDPKVSAPKMDEQGAVTNDVRPPSTTLEKTVLGLNAELNIALARVKLPVSQLQGMAVGDVIDLGIARFDQAIVQTKQGRKLALGTLGQTNGTRAVQLEHTVIVKDAPRRRASDRAELDLPKVSGDGTGAKKDPRAASGQQETGPAQTADPMAQANVPMVQQDHPDPALAELGGLPDMSDLPGFGGEGLMPEREAG